jgi:hypothetical protein
VKSNCLAFLDVHYAEEEPLGDVVFIVLVKVHVEFVLTWCCRVFHDLFEVTTLESRVEETAFFLNIIDFKNLSLLRLSLSPFKPISEFLLYIDLSLADSGGVQLIMRLGINYSRVKRLLRYHDVQSVKPIKFLLSDYPLHEHFSLLTSSRTL